MAQPCQRRRSSISGLERRSVRRRSAERVFGVFRRFPRPAVEDDRHLRVVGEGSLEVFVMVEGVTRDDEDQTGLWAGFCLPLGFTPLRQRVSGQDWSSPPTISERRPVSVAKRRDCIIKPLLALASSRERRTAAR